MFNDLKQFLEEVWREVRPDKGRVSWPTMKSIRMSTMVVMITSVMLSIYIFLCDEILRQTLGALLAVGK
ncbi:MAG: preprotein translocase subunit SecE [Candidatus Wallbacteria bacterium]|nr:preprotein translocase subunit SecE [Candidatus Wallbacteria bacterium]